MKYSDKLVEEYKRYMKKRCDYDVTDEEAQFHLASLARLYMAFARSKDPS